MPPWTSKQTTSPPGRHRTMESRAVDAPRGRQLSHFVFYFKFLKVFLFLVRLWASLVAQLVKNSPAMQETLVQFLGPDDPLEKG